MPEMYLRHFRETFETGVLESRGGDRLIEELHEDVDESMLTIDCKGGSCEVQLEERIWWTWSTRQAWRLKAGENVRTTVPVDSDFFDGDHRLSVVATMDRTSIEVDFTSRTLR